MTLTMTEQTSTAIQASRTGIILNTQNFSACRAFYRDVLGLRELFTRRDGDDELSCLEFGGAYLMIETGGHAKPAGKSVRESPAKLRFNVPDLEATLRVLHEKGIAAEIQRFDWGSTINLFDPDGNRVGIRDEAGFIAQMNP
ncbi:MAG: VOC family protein [Pseudomonadota bacterium]|nr:VOC family protein [Pseudomonadota bacterium]